MLFKVLLEDAVVHAYMQALCDVKSLLPRDVDVDMCKCWPSSSVVNKHFAVVVASFYRLLESLPFSAVRYRQGRAVSLQHASFLKPSFAPRNDVVRRAAMQVFAACQDGQQLLDVPKHVLQGFEAAGCGQFLADKTYDALRLYEQVLLPHVAGVEAQARQVLLVHALLADDERLNALLQNSACIPVEPDGAVLRRPADLVRPGGVIAHMYDVTDHRFPLGALAEPRVLKVRDLDVHIVKLIRHFF